MAQAKNAIKSMRRLRHPSVVKYLFSVESEEECCLVTEPVSSLWEVVEEMRASPAWLAWGVRQLAAALEFLHSASVVHGALCPSAVFVTAGGELVWTGTRWGSAPDGLFAHDLQTWLPLVWDDSVAPPVPQPLLWQQAFELPG